MPFVIDASVVGAWLLLDERNEPSERALQRLETDDGVAPTILWYEVCNLLLMNERRRRITEAQTTAGLATLQALPISLDLELDGEVILRLARGHRLSVYDSAYLELALRRQLPLATLDATLAAAAAKEGVPGL
jgi:predicted nucleic acid-binding protein